MADSAASDPPSAANPGQVTDGQSASGPERGKIPIETLVRSVAIVGALFYVLGFLTTNAYLYKLGVSDFSLLRTRFILTGVLTLAPLVLALIGGIYAALDVTVYGGHARLTTRAYLWILADIALPFVLYFTLFSVVAENDVVTSARDAALLSAVCAVIVLALLAALALYRKSDRRPLSHLAYWGQPITYDRFTERFGVPSAVVETMIFAVAGVVLFLAYRIGLVHGEVWATPPPIAGVAAWMSPSHTKIAEKVRDAAGSREVGVAWGTEAFARFQKFAADMRDLPAQEPHWHLNWLGVEPGHQGQGIGGTLVRQMTI